MLFLGVDRDELADQGARPVIEGDAAADAGAVEADPAAIAQRAVNVVVARDEGGVLSALPPVENLPGKAEVFERCCRLILHEDVRLRNALLQQIAPHGLRLGDRLVPAFSAGGNELRRRRILAIDLDRLVHPVAQELRSRPAPWMMT